MCDGLGRQFTYSCPNATLFQQRMLVCDHWYMVNCSRALHDYDAANRLIGKADQPFVSEEERESARRTPRPDLLTAAGNVSEYNVIYGKSRDQYYTPKNVVGVETEQDSTDKPTYYPPSHWSTEYSRSATTARSVRREETPTHNEKDYNIPKKTSGKKLAKAIDFNSARNGNNLADVVTKSKSSFQTNTPQQNYKSAYRATTPVYPTTVTTAALRDDIGLVPPIPYQHVDKHNNDPQVGPSENSVPQIRVADRKIDKVSSEEQPIRRVNFHSNFRATTPVYPSKSELKELLQHQEHQEVKGDRVPVNFESNFKATTPVYPVSVDHTSPDPGEVGLVAPRGTPKQDAKENLPIRHDANPITTERVPVNFKSNFKATTPVYPLTVEATSPNPEDTGLVPPKPHEDNRVTTDHQKENVEHPTRQSNVVFPSNFKATTPVYPTAVENTSPNPSNVGLKAPKDSKNNDVEVVAEGRPVVNFASNFKATTPVYPTSVENTSPNPSNAGLKPPQDSKNQDPVTNGNDSPLVNFVSNFKATTPVYPTSVDPTSPNPNSIGLKPPQQQTHNNLQSSSVNQDAELIPLSDLVPPAFDKHFNPEEHNVETTVRTPSKFYQPPKIEPALTGELTDQPEQNLDNTGIRILNFMKSFNNSQWQDLRKVFRIPEFDLPLDEGAVRPSYDSVLNSFEAKNTKKK
nr:unnamed protein product [Callosobruchus chinensis]